jgi:hypothetical protein|nr:MAG TPA: hypothetical protein [Caudoviricetes sp.]
MILITNNKQYLEVTKGAYESLFKPLGYQIIKNQKEENENIDRVQPNEHIEEQTIIDEENKDVDNKEENFIDDLNILDALKEIPVSPKTKGKK